MHTVTISDVKAYRNFGRVLRVSEGNGLSEIARAVECAQVAVIVFEADQDIGGKEHASHLCLHQFESDGIGIGTRPATEIFAHARLENDLLVLLVHDVGVLLAQSTQETR